VPRGRAVASMQKPKKMKVIDVSNMEVVYSGIPWMHSIPPCSKQAIQLLERNTKVVTWIMAKNGDVKEQVPCILYNTKYYSLSLRMQKAIYRHIRLKKGFANEESMDGMAKLKIPDVLLKEKMRTQSRFDVSPTIFHYYFGMRAVRVALCEIYRMRGLAYSLIFEQAMRSVQRSTNAKEKRERVKSGNTVAARMKQVVEKMIASQKDGVPHPQITVFLYKSEQSEIIASFLQEMRRENVTLFNDREMFLDLIAARYNDISNA